MLGRIFLYLLVGLLLTAVAGAVTPTLTTTAATGVTDSDASLNGTIDPMGDIFEVRAEYGLTANYGYVTQGSSNFWGNGVQSCAFHPSGLATNTTYHYRIVAKTLDGTSTYVGNDMTFTTLANPPVLGAVNAGVSSLAATEVNFSLSSLLSGSSRTTVSYEYGLTASYGSVVESPTQVDKDLIAYTTCFAKATGLTPGTTYHFRAKAVNAQGTVYSADGTFTTPLGPVLVTGAATGVTDLAATLNGTVMTDGQLLNVIFEYGLSTDYGLVISAANGVSNTSATPLSVQPPALLPATTYHYRLKASYYYDSNLVFYGQDQTFTTGAAATPPTAGTVSAPNVGATSARVSCWPVFSGSSSTTAVFQYGPTTTYGSTSTAIAEIPANVPDAAPYVDLSGLTPGTTYHVRCVVTNGQGSHASADSTFTTVMLPSVTTGAATSVGDLSAILNGGVNPNGPSTTAAVSFEFGTTTDYGTTLNGAPGSILGTGTFTASATGLMPATTYHYRAKVRYSFIFDQDYYGPDVSFTTAAAQTPPSVGAVSSNNVGASTARVQASSVFAGSSEATVFWEYQVSAGGPVLTATGTPATITLGTPSAALALLTGLQPATTYTYRCGATNGQGTSYSASATFTTLDGPTVTTAPATSVADVTAVLNGSANANGGGNYAVYFEIGPTTSYGRRVTPIGNYLTGSGPIPFSTPANHLLPNTTYHFRMLTIYLSPQTGSLDNLQIFYGADQTFTTGAPATPPTATTMSATNLAPTAVTLNASFETGSSPASLVFEYGTTNAYGSQFAVSGTFDTSTSAFFAHPLEGLTANTEYHYRIIVTNGEGTSTGQDVSVTTLDQPTVTTTAATAIRATTALLNGTCNMQGGNYTVAFDYGQTTAYGQTATSGGIILGGGVILGGGLVLGGNDPNGQNIIIIGGGNTTQTRSGMVASLLPLTEYHYRIKLTDNYGNSYYGTDASFSTIAPVQAWRQAVFNTIDDAGNAADLAAPAGDGVPNLLKYALNLDPAKPEILPQPQLKNYSGAHHLSLTFQRDPTKTDITYEVQASDSPVGPWTTLATSAGGATTSGPGFVDEQATGTFIITPLVNVEVKDVVSLQEAPRRFMRLRVTR
ncbi:hypothetical protein [Prosthecobacter sp.]|uniref:hypothetical protein n=1 Tax=Prosthecobacter sp. TaxID=1965333 RepID=UPI003783BAEA